MVNSSLDRRSVSLSILVDTTLTILFTLLPLATLRAQTEYRIGDIKITGATVLNEAQIKDVLGLVPGEVFNESRLRKGFEDLKRIYTDRGYVNFTPIPLLDFNDQRKVVNLVINIQEN